METNFFNQIRSLQVSGNVRMNIHPQENGEMIVSVLLDTTHVKDKAAKLIPPLVLKGSDSELDNGFFEAIMQPVQKTQKLLVNMQEHITATEKATNESRIVKDREFAQKKDKEAKKKKFEEQMKKVDDLVKLKKIGEAIGQLPDLKLFPEFEAEIKKKGQELRNQHGSLSLFGNEPEVEIVTAAEEEDSHEGEEEETLDDNDSYQESEDDNDPEEDNENE